MAFQLGSFIVQLLGDTSHLDGALRRVQGVASSVGKAVSGVAGGGMTIPGAEAAKTTLEGAAKAGWNLGTALQSLLQIDLSTVLQLGTIAGAVGLIGSATKKFMELNDEAKNIGFRFRTLGMETDENTKKLWAFGKTMSETYNISQGEARKMSMDALTKGLNPGRYQEMTASAIQLGAALGIGKEQALRVVEQLEAGNTQILRRLHPSFRILLEQGASRFTLEAKVNEMIAQGGVIAQERTKTFGGQIERLKNNFSDLQGAVARAIGPAFAPIVAKAADAIGTLTTKLRNYIEANEASIGSIVRTGTAIAAGAAALLLFRNRLGGILSLTRHLVPSLGGLASAFSTGYNLTPFATAKKAIASIGAAIRGVSLVALQVGVRIALFLVNPIQWANAVYQGVMMLWQARTAAVGVVAGTAAVGVRIFSLALKGVLAATGIGLLVGLVGMLMGVSDTFGDASTGVEGFGSVVKDVIAQVKAAAQPVLDWLEVEGVIVFKALVAAAHQMADNMKMLWADLQMMWGHVVAFFRENFGGAIKWLEDTYRIKIDSLKSMWEEFTAELAVLGLRIRQVFLVIVIGIMTIPAVLEWLGNCFAALANYIGTNWKEMLVTSMATVVEGLAVLGHAVMAVGEGIGRALSGESVSFDFSATEAAFHKLKDQAGQVMAGIKMPTLDTSNVAPELKAELGKVTDEIERKKQLAREAQAKDRLNAQNRNTGKTDSAGPGVNPNTRIGGRDKAQFQETVGFWKKVQEAGANQRAEYFQQQSLDQQRMMVTLLQQIKEANERKPAPAGGIVPR